MATSSAAGATSELAKDNLDRVAASSLQITAILQANPGLFVELKRWIAKDAADHGQIVEDGDLDDAAINTRLVQDQKFRAAATRLLQGYGYLLPNANPNSDIGRERDALIQLRIRRLLSTGSDGNATAKCDAGENCDSQANQFRSSAASENNTANTNVLPGPLPADRDSDQLLINPVGGNQGASQDDGGRPLLRTLGNAENSSFATTAMEGSPALSSITADQQALAQARALDGMDGVTLPGETFDATQLPRAAVSQDSGATSNVPRNGAASKAMGFEAESAAEAGPPSMPARRSPYSDIPSVYDMFAQATTSAGEPVKRFGEGVFQNFQNGQQAVAGNIPIDFPASSDYVIGPGDGLTIDLWGGVSQRLSRTVDREGRVVLPEVGPVLVNGQSLGEVQQAVQRLLRTQFHDVSADVSLSRLRTVRVYVVGDVTRPGAYDVSSLSTPLNALLAAGGPTSAGSLRVVKHYRGEALVQQVDLYDLLLHGVRSDVKRLEPGDTLQVAPVGAQIRVDGMVRRPAIYELRDETTLAQAIDLAGGMLPAAALTHIEVQRLEAHEKRTMLSLDIPPGSDADEIEQKMEAFAIRDRDEIHVFPIATFNQDAVYLQGHVLRAGRYSYHPGMTFEDLVTSYADLLPEAAKYAEIIRLNPPDYHPSVQSVDLAAVLSGATAAPALARLDTVRVFSRFDFENPPTVSVNGAVRRPGTYQTSGEIHFVDALQLSGGATPDAALDAAQVIRILPDGSAKILSVSVKEALAGDAGNNILLQPRDRILIQRSILRADPPSLLVGGEVANPGRYALTQNLRVADLVRIAGGLKRGAEGDSADLTQFVVSDNAPLTAAHVNIDLSAAMAGDPTQNVLLRDGDVLTIRQAPGWNDRSAAVILQGEVKHPGTYGIRPGERLSSVLQRAGGFDPEAYPYGAVFERPQVREVETKSRQDMVLRVQNAENALALLPDTDPRQRAAKESAIQQWQSNLEELNANPPVGRVAIHISPDIARWKNTNADIEVHAGDIVVIPKRPGYVMVSGQVFNSTAISYRAGRSAEWYLSQAGGPTPLANKKAVFVIRADGSVMGGKSGMFGGDSLGSAVQPGDTVVVPEKALSGNVQWQNVLLAAQVAASIATTVYIAARY